MGKTVRPEKLQDMIRSILPSKNREVAREAKSQLTRSVRRAVRADVKHEDPEETKRDFCRDANQSENVFWRRGGDKLNHFMRWCHAITSGMPAEQALSVVKSLVPKNVIGEHAYSHWELERSPRYNWGRPFSRSSYRERDRRRVQSIFDRTRHHLRRALELEPDRLGTLNAEIKRWKPLDARRLLRGMHDIDDFVSTILFGEDAELWKRYRWPWPEQYAAERECTVRLITEVEAAHGPKRRIDRCIPPRR